MLNYAQFIPCTIDHTQVTADAVDFPHLILISEDCGTGDSDLTVIFDELDTDCLKLSVAYTNDVEMYTEVATWDAVNEIGELYSEMTISSAADTEYRIYFDADADDNTSYVGLTGSTPAKAVWNSGYVYVSHMNDLTTSSIADSTSNNITGTKKGANEPVEAAGLVGKAQSFDGVNDYINIPQAVSQALTGSGYGFFDLLAQEVSAPAEQGYLFIIKNASSGARLSPVLKTTSKINAIARSGTESPQSASDISVTEDQWFVAGGGAMLSEQTIRLSLDGETTDYTGKSFAASTYQNSTSTTDTIGAYSSAVGRLNIIVDELRISNVARSTDWISLTNKSLTDALNTFGGICYKASFLGKTSRTVKQASSFGGETLRVVKQVSDFGGVTLRKVIAESSFSGQTLRTVKALSGYSAATFRIVTRAAPPPALKYTLEVRNSSGALVSILENANKGKYTQRVNEPAQLSFEVPATDSKVSGLTKPNQIWLRDYSTGTLIRKFIITRVVKSDSGNCIYQVECKGYLAKLLKAPVVSYNPTNQTPTQILTALLAYQTLDTITLGTVAITGTYSFSWNNTNVLGCLNNCLEAWGGYFDVSDDNKLDWLLDVGEDKGQQIRYRKNLVTVEVEDDYEGQYSRIFATGNSLDLMDYEPSFDPVTQSADASFGYLTLQDYKCYSAWTGDGDALPYGFGQDITVYRVGSEFSISFFSCSGAGWIDAAKAIDGNTGTSAYYNVNGWTGYLDAGVNVTPVLCTGLRWNIGADLSSYIIGINVLYSVNGTDWIGVEGTWDSAWFNDWGQYDFAEPTLVKYMRLRVRTNALHYVYVYEMEMRSTYTDDTADFVQGANEQIVKCDIGDYHSTDTYYLGYTHALYIKDFAASSTYGDEAINSIFNYAGDAETLLKYAQAQMVLIKDPPKYYQSGIIFLNEVDTNFSEEELDLGNIVNIIHEPLNVDDSVRIVGMSQELDNPMNGSVEIQTKIRSLADSFRALWSRI